MFDWLFGEPVPPPKTTSAERYSFANVSTLLDQIGQARLTIAAPRIKVLLTKISQNGEAYLKRNAPDGNPSVIDITQFQDDLETLLRVLTQYVEIQNNQRPDRLARLHDGFKAVNGFAAKVLSSNVPGGQSSMTNFTVDTKILGAQRFTS